MRKPTGFRSRKDSRTGKRKVYPITGRRNYTVDWNPNKAPHKKKTDPFTKTKNRVRYLRKKMREGELSPDEQKELEQYLMTGDFGDPEEWEGPPTM
jgi:hypothetical protein